MATSVSTGVPGSAASHPIKPPIIDQSKLLEQAKFELRARSFLFKHATESDNWPAMFRQIAGMVAELRNQNMDPQTYFLLVQFMNDRLSMFRDHIQRRFADGGEPLGRVYEWIQGYGDALPRLYMMTIIGEHLIDTETAAAHLVIHDLLVMAKAIQHPMRGLFLRDFMIKTLQEKLPDLGSPYLVEGVSPTRSIDFVMANFIEMNRLWVRLHHQGAFSKAQERQKLRQQLRQLVGTNLRYLSQLKCLTPALYSSTVLPQLLEQLRASVDPLAQRYLLDVIVVVFPDPYHILTIDKLLGVLPELEEEVDVVGILSPLVKRLVRYVQTDVGSLLNPDQRRALGVTFLRYSHRLILPTPVSMTQADAPAPELLSAYADDEDDEEVGESVGSVDFGGGSSFGGALSGRSGRAAATQQGPAMVAPRVTQLLPALDLLQSLVHIVAALEAPEAPVVLVRAISMIIPVLEYHSKQTELRGLPPCPLLPGSQGAKLWQLTQLLQSEVGAQPTLRGYSALLMLVCNRCARIPVVMSRLSTLHQAIFVLPMSLRRRVVGQMLHVLCTMRTLGPSGSGGLPTVEVVRTLTSLTRCLFAPHYWESLPISAGPYPPTNPVSAPGTLHPGPHAAALTSTMQRQLSPLYRHRARFLYEQYLVSLLIRRAVEPVAASATTALDKLQIMISAVFSSSRLYLVHTIPTIIQTLTELALTRHRELTQSTQAGGKAGAFQQVSDLFGLVVTILNRARHHHLLQVPSIDDDSAGDPDSHASSQSSTSAGASRGGSTSKGRGKEKGKSKGKGAGAGRGGGGSLDATTTEAPRAGALGDHRGDAALRALVYQTHSTVELVQIWFRGNMAEMREHVDLYGDWRHPVILKPYRANAMSAPDSGDGAADAGPGRGTGRGAGDGDGGGGGGADAGSGTGPSSPSLAAILPRQALEYHPDSDHNLDDEDVIRAFGGHLAFREPRGVPPEDVMLARLARVAAVAAARVQCATPAHQLLRMAIEHSDQLSSAVLGREGPALIGALYRTLPLLAPTLRGALLSRALAMSSRILAPAVRARMGILVSRVAAAAATGAGTEVRATVDTGSAVADQAVAEAATVAQTPTASPRVRLSPRPLATALFVLSQTLALLRQRAHGITAKYVSQQWASVHLLYSVLARSITHYRSLLDAAAAAAEAKGNGGGSHGETPRAAAPPPPPAHPSAGQGSLAAAEDAPWPPAPDLETGPATADVLRGAMVAGIEVAENLAELAGAAADEAGGELGAGSDSRGRSLGSLDPETVDRLIAPALAMLGAARQAAEFVNLVRKAQGTKDPALAADLNALVVPDLRVILTDTAVHHAKQELLRRCSGNTPTATPTTSRPHSRTASPQPHPQAPSRSASASPPAKPDSGLDASGLDASGLDASGLDASGLDASGLDASPQISADGSTSPQPDAPERDGSIPPSASQANADGASA